MVKRSDCLLACFWQEQAVKSAGVRGATLLELLLAVAILSISVVVLSLTFPSASASITTNRQRTLATGLGSALIQQLHMEPYATIIPTDSALFSGPGAANCDCSQEDLATMPVSAIYTEAGITYTRRWCVNLVDRSSSGNWFSYCDNGTSSNDRGLKNMRVRVDWMSGGKNHFVHAESLVTRQ